MKSTWIDDAIKCLAIVMGGMAVVCFSVTVLLIAVSGCDATPSIEVNRSKEEMPTGWIIESQGTFYAGYGNNRREILTIVSPEGKKYLAITGCGVTELSKTGGQTPNVVKE